MSPVSRPSSGSLADAVRPLLDQPVHAHFAVGYFFLSGFKAIAGELDRVQELRLLIGNTSDRATIEQLAEGHASREAIIAKQREGEFLNARQKAKLMAEGERQVRARLERLDQTDEDQALVTHLVRPISENRLKTERPAGASGRFRMEVTSLQAYNSVYE